ncbi:MAG: adenosylhomocysteinase [Candidatus Lokiarchaeota archaeon]|nr:adenosylhomocysteinase [Candidatus Lokiarchaeota archaeon]
MVDHKIKDLNLAPEGDLLIEWAEKNMPVLMKIKERFEREKPLKGIRVAACLHVTKETAVLIKTLVAGGAEVALTASNPLSTNDAVAASLAKSGINTYAFREQNNEEYYLCLNKSLDIKPHITLDDGADLISTVHSKRTELIDGIIGGCEETTTGVIRLRAMHEDGALKYPVFAVNDSATKRLFDNHYGTGQSTMDGILRATAILMAGKNVVVSGYGQCSKGIAMRARGMGANTIVTEVEPVKALQALYDGFQVMPLMDAAKVGDLFITSTGDKHVIDKQHMELMKDGAIMCNSGHFNVEINIPALESMAKSQKILRPNLVQFTLKNGKTLVLLAEGRLVNLAAAEGHPSEVMDMSFANQSLAVETMAKEGKNLEVKVHVLPQEVDNMVASLKLESMGVKIDVLTSEQKKYLSSWEEGT